MLARENTVIKISEFSHAACITTNRHNHTVCSQQAEVIEKLGAHNLSDIYQGFIQDFRLGGDDVPVILVINQKSLGGSGGMFP